jgi:hypothetical protein
LLDAFSEDTLATPLPTTTNRSLDEVGLAAHVDGWTSVIEDWNGVTAGSANDAVGSFVAGPSGAQGAGSYRIDLGAPVGANNGKLYFGRTLTGVPLADLTGLRYRTLTPTTNADKFQPYVNITVEGGGTNYSNLVFEPTDSQANPNAASIVNGSWNTVDAFAPGAKWRATSVLAGQPKYTYRTLTEWLALAPDLRTHSTVGGVYLVAGASSVTPGWTGYQANVDQLDITVAGTTTAYGIDNPAPAAVEGLAAANITPSGFDVSWTAAPHAVSYDVKVGGLITSQTGVTKTVTAIAASTPVLVQVRARNSAGVGPWEIVLVTTAATAALTSTMTVTPGTTTFGSTVAVGGVVKAGGAGVGGQRVTIARKYGSAWRVIGRVTTAANGSWRLAVAAGFPTSLLSASVPGYPTATATVRVAIKATVSVSKRTVRTTVAPVLTGHLVYLQVWSGGHWNAVSKTVLRTGSKASLTAPHRGAYRVVVLATHGYLQAASAAFAVR